MKSATQLIEELKRRNRYRSFLIQKQDVEANRLYRTRIEDGNDGTNQERAQIELTDGALYTSPEVRDRILLENELLWRPKQPPAPLKAVSVVELARNMNHILLYTSWNPSFERGTVIINDQELGNLGYFYHKGDLTINEFQSSNYFTPAKDNESAWLVVDGNLTIPIGVEVIPDTRKLFTVIYSSGDIVLDGSISMTGRGANHSGTGDSGGATTAAPITLAKGDFILASDGVTKINNPYIPATGGAGGPPRTSAKGANNGTDGTDGGTGGGGSGYRYFNGTSGGGSDGTCFSGGSGGGACFFGGNATSGGANGGAGGNATETNCGGGTGNLGGLGTGTGGVNGNDGTGGVLIIICEGSLTGTGTATANGIAGNRPTSSIIVGGASGGGGVHIFCKSNPGGAVSISATGGAGNTGGAGGAGTARKLLIP